MRFNKLLIILMLTLHVFSCSNDDNDTPPEQLVTKVELNGVLGEKISIQGENFEPNKLQVFFDLEKAQINFLSPELIEVIVPRTLERSNPTIKVINLITNKDILNENFTLRAPKISGFGGNQITFNETLVINGENFDIQKDFVEVYVNDEKAQLIHTNYDQLEVLIPHKITEASLTIKVKSQLQEAISTGLLTLRPPEIQNIINDVAWLRGNLTISGINFNPEYEYGEVFVNGVKSHFSSQNTSLFIDVPLGPYSDFKITNITYSTAGLTTSFDLDVDIENVGVMVDLCPNLNGDVVVYNNKGYIFTSKKVNSNDTMQTIEMLEFSPETEKWTKVESFGFQGYINNVVFDNDSNIYLYKGEGTNGNELTKLNLNTFTETKIDIPFHQSLSHSAIFCNDGDLFVLNGMTYENDQSIVSNKKYRYKSDVQQWEEITSNLFSDTVWKKSVVKKIFHNGNLYFSSSANTSIYRLNADYSVTIMPGTNMLFSYGTSLIGRRSNIVNERMRLYNIFDETNGIDLAFGDTYHSAGRFFVINDNIYYHKSGWLYDGKVELATYKLKKELINEIL
ncbi:hypothetical protein F6U93_01070 [Tamlana haliotis]|uniref:IPT/TIG domain-containing protein n=1 Tax=Pseudotamlana haliotis TaxID=2614804 RepID=A0A6N6MRW4_9FLAO|nr:IPT/TIG domain-containing protein [Tamlana haliotis]KAB1071347.1 hypothetical protein F6U93_01070 [Tamlana haliotis]